MQITPEAANDIEQQQRRHDLQARRPLRPRNQHPLRHLPPARTARPLRRRRGGGAGRLQRRAGQRRQVGRGGPHASRTIPFPETRAYVEEVLEKRDEYRQKYARSWATDATPPRPRVAALALAVGLVLADSSIVVLALPEIYRELDTSVAGVTWVLVSFNLVMALAAVPAALLARRVGPGADRRGRAGDLRRRRPRLRPRRRALDPDPRPLRAGARRRRRGHRGAGAAAGDGRLRAARGDGLGRRGGDRRRARAGDRRHPHRARLLAVDLPPPGAGGAGRRRCRSSPSPGTRRRPGSSSRSCAAPAARTSGPTSPWRWSRRRSPRRSSCSSCC